ncbi:cytochrome-c oxidase, cbb3-type subunit III [Paracoccus tegillarcae]|uniref:Cbb3-type cytochrome c oxidase subunit n=1 Tax=Paracoccus tegillarcae TaxID=1529068 RepID=A0A2K9ECP1_9RHOB|nr:cytochrome-c oxidase, cbb3-type subunit III [Paracoccus tegillarcae]AUH32680.1 cytochrome-c oxidase, cbb3-type subunit III [Paracoccus tegillarcae]
MSVKERDPLTGHQTTGHEWNGITELNTPVPQVIWISIAVTTIVSFVMWILLPTWPLVSTYTKGILGVNQRAEVEAAVIEANQERSDWATQINDLPTDQILADPDLAMRVRNTGHQLFGDNCAACHGTDAGGGPGFPSLTDSAWLWGGDHDAIMETLRVGISSDHPDTRFAQMLAFGRDGILSRDEVRAVAAYVRSLSGASAPAAQLEEGEILFADNCSSCHAEDGTGDITQGAPNLTDDFWIYGGSSAALFQTIYGGRQGWMPAWETRLTETERKILAVYVQDLGLKAAEGGAE